MILELIAIGRNFRAVTALSDVSLSVAAGEVVVLMGENGSGKSTLLRIAGGDLLPSSGSIRFRGRDAPYRSAAEARAAGVELVGQEPALCDNLSAAANIFLGRELKRGVGPVRIVDTAAMDRRARQMLAAIGSGVPSGRRAAAMSAGERRVVALARAEVARPVLLLLDEPTAALAVAQAAKVLDLARAFRDAGTAILIASHNVEEAFAIADRVVILRRGTKIADRAIGITSRDEIAALIGAAAPAARIPA
ncbi:MAG TPA: ATP-binding cassette domain-containing protein [Bauldia sp.]|nr:ATP-binding cassette domain-containing protein [Bauldia sp.]